MEQNFSKGEKKSNFLPRPDGGKNYYISLKINRFVNQSESEWCACAKACLEEIKKDEVNHSPFSLLNDFALTRTTKLPTETFSVMLA